jgi:phage terminase large subunit GpA-like protein
VILKLSGLKHREVPLNAVKLTSYFDTQDESFWYVVIAWTADFGGYVIDYGVWPDQGRRDISKTRLVTKLSEKYSKLKNREAIHRAALKELCEEVLDQTYYDAEGGEHRITAAAVDVGDGEVRRTIPSWIAGQKKWKTILRPSVGVGVKTTDTPFAERKHDKKKTRRVGLNWYEAIDPATPGGSIVYIDVNSWKTFVANRWRAGGPRPADDPTYRPNEPGALYLWGTDPRYHATFGSHQCCEFVTRVKVEKTGRVVDQWLVKPNQNDNEHWDAIVGCAVLADYAGGVSLKNTGLKLTVRKKRRKTKKADVIKM